MHPQSNRVSTRELLKGQQREMVSLPIRSCIEWVFRIRIFCFWSKILRDRINSMSIGVFSIYHA
jgi:hypothetical protein